MHLNLLITMKIRNDKERLLTQPLFKRERVFPPRHMFCMSATDVQNLAGAKKPKQSVCNRHTKPGGNTNAKSE